MQKKQQKPLVAVFFNTGCNERVFSPKPCVNKVTISQNSIKLTDNIKYLEIFVDNKLTWKTHIDFLSKKLSEVCLLYDL